LRSTSRVIQWQAAGQRVCHDPEATSRAPALYRVTVLADLAMDPTPLNAAEAVARSLGVRVHIVHVRGAQDIDAAVRTATKAGSGEALYLIPSPSWTVTPLGTKSRSSRS
jgi:hypothetical protein